MALLSGKTGYVLLGTRAYRFGKWELPIECGTPKANNFIDAPFSVFVTGLLSAKLTADGPYDAQNMPLSCGTTYVFTLGWTPGLNISVTAILNNLTPSNDVENNPLIKIGAQVTGSFTFAVT